MKPQRCSLCHKIGHNSRRCLRLTMERSFLRAFQSGLRKAGINLRTAAQV